MNLLTFTTQSYSRSYQYLKHGPGHFFMYAFGRFRVVRSFMVWAYSLRNTRPLAGDRPTLVEDVDVDEAARTIDQDGFFPGLRLRKEVVEQLLAFSSMATCYADGNPDLPFRHGEKEIIERQSGRNLKLGKFLHAFSASPVLQALASDPQLRAIARKYLRTEPVLVSARMWWSFSGPTDARQQMRDGQGFHYDIDGYRALAFFFYLTDVGPTNGPHVYVRGSHTRKLLRHIASIYKGRKDAEIEKVYGLERQVVCCGPAGSGFAEDIFGFHKGQHPESGDRLIVQLRYGLRDYGTGHND
jgi:Phytanoyl-CoA dioxygenase (PhyH)